MERLLLAFLLLSVSYVVVSSYNVPAIFTFGDSILDAGNNHFIKNCTAQADFSPYGSSYFHYPTGRFTNGRTVPDFISQFLGIDFQKPYMEAQISVMNGSQKNYPSNGVNFASAGSGVLRDTNEDWLVTSIPEQLQQFQTLIEQDQIDKTLIRNSLFLFQSGSNDIFNYFSSFEPPALDPAAYVQAMLAEVANLLDQICKLGARRVAVISLGPVGCVPARTAIPGAPINRCHGKMNNMVKNYNKGLEILVKNTLSNYPGAIGVYGLGYDIVQQFRATPQRYGFKDVDSACCGDGTLRGMVQCGKEGYKMCSNPDEYLFWDYFHPSEHSYKLIAKALWTGTQNRIQPFNLMTLANMTLPPV